MCNCKRTRVSNRFVRNELLTLSAMLEYLKQTGWVWAGNCGSCDHGTLYLNSKYPGWRLKVKGNISGIIQQNQNPMNRNDFKNLFVFDMNNYTTILTMYFQ